MPDHRRVLPKTLSEWAVVFLVGGTLAATAVLANSMEQEIKVLNTKSVRKQTGKIIDTPHYKVKKDE